ncbi:MAG TPA: glycosyltransferase [Candidatus Eisenbergiella pullicola]|nr:glycosyltransferase [Candidatus Eisenbergiella pullicola]
MRMSERKISEMFCPKVSVIMPAYNGEKYIAKAIESILQQTYEDFELIIIDDCGGDDSIAIAETYKKTDGRIRIIHNPCNKGIAYSRNVGLDVCKGKYVAIMDDDDYAFECRLEKQVEFLDNNPEYDVVGGKAQLVDEYGTVIRPEIDVLKDSKKIKTMFLFFNLFHNSEVMFRKKIIDEHSIRYEDGLLGMEDFKFWIRISKIGAMTNLEDLILQHRITPDTETNRVKKEMQEERKRVFASLQRFSLEESGFVLKEEQYQILNKVLNEDGTSSAESKEEMFAMYNAFYELIMQARKKSMDIVIPMEYWFRDLFADKVALISADNMWD